MAQKPFNKFNNFVLALAQGKHDLTTAQLKVALCNSLNEPNTDAAKLADLVEINYTYLSSRDLTVTDAGQVDGLFTLAVDDLTITATVPLNEVTQGFQYVVVYNDSATDKDLIGWFARDADITLEDGDEVQVIHNASGLLTLQ